MAEKREKPVSARREFLKLASLGTVVGGAGLLLQDGTAKAAGTQSDETAAGYRETPHVKAFYDSTRF